MHILALFLIGVVMVIIGTWSGYGKGKENDSATESRTGAGMHDPALPILQRRP